jgi:uncharacterized SAM-binding protein YcdF (DUF218 family)
MTRRRRAAIALAALGLGGTLALPLGLGAMAAFLVVADPLIHSDALYVFPGAVPERAACAADLFRRGMAPTVVVTGERIRPELAVVGMPLSDAEINAQVLAHEGLPQSAIVVRPEGTSTWEDAHALRAWALEQHGLRRLTAVTSPQHARRARGTLLAAFRGTGIDVRVWPCPAALPADWWRREETVLPVINEFLKLAYYAVAH